MRSLRPILALMCSLAFVGACDDDPATPVEPPVPTPAVWSEIAGYPPAPTFYALWVPQENYVIAVGPRGLVMRWDGMQWAPIENTTANDLHAIAGATVGEIVAAGDRGRIVRFDGARFVPVTTPTSEDLRGLWTPGGNEFVAVGAGGTILRGDGVAWLADASPVTDALYAVWGSAPDDVFAVGLNGVILHYDGTTWSSMTSGTGAFLAGVGGAGPADVYAVGEGGVILHYDGDAWNPMTSGTTNVLQGVWASNEAFAVGANGTILRLEGGGWSAFAGVTQEWLYGVARAGSRTWVVGARAICAHDGSAWTTPTRGAVPVLNGVAGPPDAPLRIVGNDGYIARLGGDTWVSESTGDARPIAAIWCDERGGVFAVGRNRIMYHDGVAWVEEFSDPVELLDVAGGPAGVYAVGANATILRRGGSSWSGVRPITPISENLHAYASISANEAYIVGAQGRLLGYNGATWSVEPSRVSVDLHDVTGDVPGTLVRAIAVGAAGTIIGLNPAPTRGWERMSSPTGAALFALARGPGSDLYAVGESGVVLSFDGAAWALVSSPTLKPLRSAWCDGHNLFVAGGDAAGGVILLRFGSP